MLSLQLVSELQAGASVVTPFQPWWEILIDYSLTGFLMTVLLGLAGVTLTGTTEIVCQPIQNKTFTTDISISLFVNSRCSRTFGGSFLLYYPYIALVAYLVLLFGHLLSVKLPSTSSFLSVMFQLFADFKTLRNSSAYFGGAVVTCPEEQRVYNETRKGGKRYKILKLEVKEQVIALVERLIFTLQSNSGFFIVYVAKSAILFIGSTLVISGNIVTLVVFDWSLVFDCDLSSSVSPAYEMTTCTIPAAPFLYGLMIISTAFTFFVLIFTVRAVAWLIQTRDFKAEYLSSWKKGEHVLRNMPGFHDFCFCLMLMKHNGTDGEFVYETVNSSLKIYTSLKIQEHLENDQLLGTTVASDLQFKRDNYICDFMLQEMGMKSRETSQTHDLFTTLNGLELEDTDNKKDGGKKLRQMIFNELVTHPTRYKDMIDNSTENLPSFREYVKSIKDGSFVSGDVSECHYVLIAFANCTRTKIVLLRSRRCSFVFTPLEVEQPPVIFLKHVPPSDYVPVCTLDDASTEQCSNRERFLDDNAYSEIIRQKALESWKSMGYRNFLDAIKSLLPKFLTGTEDALDRVDGSPADSAPVKAHLAYLDELGLGEKEKDEEETDSN